MDEKPEDYSPVTPRSGSYPLQTPEFTPHPEISQGQSSDKLHTLPSTLRAVKDNQTAVNHPRTLVICLDGTGDQFDNDNSNIVHLVSCMKKHSPDEQVTYYQSGIGTYDKGGLTNGIGAALDMAVGSGLGVHVKDAYKFLMQHYHEGDKICLFGFSRGAYTVRCLAGMLHKVGLLPASNVSQVNFAYNFYKDDSEEGYKMSEQFKHTFCTDVNVYYMGLFDCVASVGFFPRKLPFSKTPTNGVHYFRHAMALDEHRAKFKQCHWRHEGQNVGNSRAMKRRGTVDMTPMARIKRSGLVTRFKKKSETVEESNGKDDENGFLDEVENMKAKKSLKQQMLEAKFDEQDRLNRRNHTPETNACEVWFKGCHADVGGGAVHNDTRHMLSRIPLRWMLRQCFECDTGILFDTAALAEQGLDVHNLFPEYIPASRPTVGPPLTLLEKKENETLAPLQRRSLFLPIEDRSEKIRNAPSPKDLSYIIPSESTEDHFDACADMNDQLVQAKGWWTLEFWPVKVRVLSKDGRWEKKVALNRGRYRAVRETEPKCHWTVHYLMDEGKYKIKTRVDKNTHWVSVA